MDTENQHKSVISADGILTTSSVNDHFDYMKGWYNYVNEFGVVKTAKAGYDRAKHATVLTENALNKVENGIQNGLTNIAAPVYVNYCYPATDRLLQYYIKSLDTTKSAADKAVNAATYTAALSIGLAVVATKMGIIVTHSAANAFLSSLLYTKKAGTDALESASHARTSVENIIHNALEQTQKIAKVPAEKIPEHANTFLDNANAVFDRLLELPEATEPTDAAIGDRIAFLSNRVSDGLVNQGNNNVIVPVKAKLHDLAQQMQSNLNMDIFWRGSNIIEDDIFESDEPFFDRLHYTIPNPNRKRVISLHNGA